MDKLNLKFNLILNVKLRVLQLLSSNPRRHHNKTFP